MGNWPRFLLLVEVRPVRAREVMPPPAPPMLRLRAALETLLRAFGNPGGEVASLLSSRDGLG
jgi:hypothetical protein